MKNLMAGGLFFFIGLAGQKVAHNLAIVKLHKAETVFVQFDRPKIENHLLTPESL